MEPRTRTGRIIGLVAIHACVLAILSVLEGPFLRAHREFLIWGGKAVVLAKERIPGEPDKSVRIMTLTSGVVATERTLELPRGTWVDVHHAAKQKPSVLRSWVRKAVSDDFWEFFQQFGLVYAGLVVFSFVWVYDPGRRKYVLVFVIATVVTVVAVWLIQHAVAKLRISPGTQSPAYLPFPQGFLKTTGLSFPSGHTTCAFALATVLAHLYPRTRALFYMVATATGISRIVAESHWLSDVYGGVLLGYWGARWVIWKFESAEPAILSRLPRRLRSALYPSLACGRSRACHPSLAD